MSGSRGRTVKKGATPSIELEMAITVLLNDPTLVKRTKVLLESRQLLSKSRKIERSQDESYRLPIDLNAGVGIEDLRNLLADIQYKIVEEKDEDDDVLGLNKTDMRNSLLWYLKNQKIDLEEARVEQLISCIPTRWSLYPPMVLFPFKTFDSPCWAQFFDEYDKDKFLRFIIDTHFQSFTHLCINRPIVKQDNEMRSPCDLVPLYGDTGPVITDQRLIAPLDKDFEDEFWCHVVQNGIYQTWAPKYTMFSRGNIKEKKRILDTFKNIQDQAVVDLYCGIGYFTYSYLKRGAKRLFCWEINPWSITGIVKGAQVNKFPYMVIREGESIDWKKFLDEDIRLVIFHESNELALERFRQIKENTGLQYPISHINLGLLPSSKPTWPITCDIINKYSSCESTDIHIHENIGADELDDFMENTSSLFKSSYLTSYPNTTISPKLLIKVKTFAPDVWHIVGDFTISKEASS